MAHAQKPDFLCPIKSVGASVQSTAGSRGVFISLSNAGYTTFGGGVRVSVMCSALRRELQLTPQRRTHHRNTKHKLPHSNITVFINILNILSNE